MHGDDPAAGAGKLVDRHVEKLRSARAGRHGLERQPLVRPTDFDQDVTGVLGLKELDSRRIVAFLHGHFDVAEEACDSHPEVVANQHERLQAAAIALADRQQELGSRVIHVMVQPLLELIEDDQHLCFGRLDGPFAERRGCFDQA